MIASKIHNRPPLLQLGLHERRRQYRIFGAKRSEEDYPERRQHTPGSTLIDELFSA
jgi:hypothetical protein